MGTTATVRKQLKARRIEAEWEAGPDRFVVLAVAHSKYYGALIATLRRERREMSGGLESRIYAPFQDLANVGTEVVARYSAKALEEFFQRSLRQVEERRDDTTDIVGMFFAEGTTA